MNLLLLYESDRVADDRFRVAGSRARHVREVLGAELGATLRAGLLNGPVGTVRVVSIEDDAIALEADLREPGPPPSGLHLLLAIPRPKMLRRLLPQVTAMGVESIVLLRTWRVEKPYLTSHVLRAEEYRPLLHEGLMQARATREPSVRIEPLFRPYVEDRAADEYANATRLVAHPTAATPLRTLRPGDRQPVAVAIGPEGGFVPFEIGLLEAAGFVPVSLGGRTLRTDTATLAILAQLDLLRRL